MLVARNISNGFFIAAGIVLTLILTAFTPNLCFSAEIANVDFKLIDNNLYVTTAIRPDKKLSDDLDNGISKEFLIYIDLFRVWKIWPNEFITGKKITRVLKTDPIKRQYAVTTIDGNLQIEKNFKDLAAMTSYAFNIIDMKLTNTRELESGAYFVKVTVESIRKKLPPVIGYLLFFVPEREFKISADSNTFQLKH
jgi:hypothetical protein